jgi:hypothetical protein
MPAPGTRIETLPPLACLHCAATQASMRRERQRETHMRDNFTHELLSQL